jgi:hypothetical protein
MNYELAKELKDAGFPQQLRAGTMLRKNSGPENTDAYAPTLEELIEACPKRLTEEGAKDVHFSLTWQYMVLRGGDCWVAEYIIDELAMGDTGFGDTPDEAVAQLWLVLKKKERRQQLR